MVKQQDFDENLLSPLEKQARKVMSFVQYNKPKKPIGWTFILGGLALYYLFATFIYNREISSVYLIVLGIVAVVFSLHWFSYINRNKLWLVLKEELSTESKGLIERGTLLSEVELKDLFIEKVKLVNMKKMG